MLGPPGRPAREAGRGDRRSARFQWQGAAAARSPPAAVHGQGNSARDPRRVKPGSRSGPAAPRGTHAGRRPAGPGMEALVRKAARSAPRSTPAPREIMVRTATPDGAGGTCRAMQPRPTGRSAHPPHGSKAAPRRAAGPTRVDPPRRGASPIPRPTAVTFGGTRGGRQKTRSARSSLTTSRMRLSARPSKDPSGRVPRQLRRSHL